MDAKLQRREFLGSVSLAVGGAAVASWMPASLLQAAPAGCLVNAADHPDACGDWQLDDVFTAYPPYSMHMKASLAAAGACSASAHPADWHWIA